jgi:hypothetical protein
VILLAGCATGPQSKVPPSIVDVSEYGENIYDAAQAGDWTTASTKLAALKKAAGQLPIEIPQMNADQKQLQAQVAADIATLQRSVPAKDKQAAAVASNDVTLAGERLSAPFSPTVPPTVTHLDYLGRELTIGSAAGDLANLPRVAAEIQSTWTALRPSIEAKSAVEAKKFGALVDHVAACKTAKEYEQSATPMLDEVDRLEKLFK